MAERQGLSVGAGVWAEWSQDVFYKGKVHSITNVLEVKFEDEEVEKYEIGNINESIVMDKELNDTDVQNLKIGDLVLVKLVRHSKAMHKGIIKAIGKIFYTIELMELMKHEIIRKRSSSLRLLSTGDSTGVSVKEEHDNSVEILDVINHKRKPEEKLLDANVSMAAMHVLPKPLSPVVVWGGKNLINFQSPTDNKNNTITCTPDDHLPHQTIGLSMDPLHGKMSAMSASNPARVTLSLDDRSLNRASVAVCGESSENSVEFSSLTPHQQTIGLSMDPLHGKMSATSTPNPARVTLNGMSLNRVSTAVSGEGSENSVEFSSLTPHQQTTGLSMTTASTLNPARVTLQGMSPILASTPASSHSGESSTAEFSSADVSSLIQ